MTLNKRETPTGGPCFLRVSSPPLKEGADLPSLPPLWVDTCQLPLAFLLSGSSHGLDTDLSLHTHRRALLPLMGTWEVEVEDERLLKVLDKNIRLQAFGAGQLLGRAMGEPHSWAVNAGKGMASMFILRGASFIFQAESLYSLRELLKNY